MQTEMWRHIFSGFDIFVCSWRSNNAVRRLSVKLVNILIIPRKVMFLLILKFIVMLGFSHGESAVLSHIVNFLSNLLGIDVQLAAG